MGEAENETHDSILVVVQNVVLIVNAGGDQSVDINESDLLNATYSNAGTLKMYFGA